MMRKITNRRGIAALAVASATISMVSLAPAAHATSTVGGQITAAEMMSRAQYWVDNNVPYTESGATAPDPQGTQYREDCSGFVSMAWHLNQSLIVTDPAPADFTNVDGTPNTTYDHGIGAFTNLQQGDAMASPHNHIFLFDQWTDKTDGDFTYYAESNPDDPTHGPTPANINSSSLEGWPTSSYVGLRYNNLASAIPTGFTVAIDANGSAAAGQTVHGAVTLTAPPSAQGYINTLSYTITGPGGYSASINGGSGSTDYSQPWSTAGLADGTYSISVTANETDGQNHTYGPVSATVANGLNASDSTFSVYNPDTKSMILFGLGSGGHLGFTKSANGGASWSNWAEANAYWTLQGTPAAVYDAAAKTTMVFARGSADGAMGISTSTNDGASWSNWTAANAYWSNFKGDASAIYNPDTKTVTVFARGSDGKIGYTQSGNGGASWSNWAEVNAYWANFSGDPHAIYNPFTKTITVFAKGGDGRIGYTQSTNDGASWSNWAEVNAYWANFSGNPHVVLNPDTKTMMVFAKGGDGRMGYTRSTNGGASWSNWAEVSAYWANFSGDAYPVYNAATKTISLLARGGDNSIGVTMSSNDGAGWSNWAQANAFWNGFTGDPTGLYDPATSQSTVFALGSGGHMGYSQSVNSVNGWTNWAEVNAYWTLIGS